MEYQTQQSVSTPLISVIIPVYNKEKYLRSCLDSVLNSSFSALEVICVDDGSSDSSLQILQEYAENDPRIKVYTQNHLYAGTARNTGMNNAIGKYIHFLDADDQITDASVYAKWYQIAEKNHIDVCECLHFNVNADSGEIVSTPGYFLQDNTSPLRIVCVEKNPHTLIYGNVVPWNKLYLRSFLIEKEIQFDDLICAEDRSFYFDVIFNTERIARVLDRWVIHRVNIRDSLDGSDIRFRHFDVEFRSFERIWDIVKTASDKQKKAVLDTCIGDSFYFYGCAIGTEYELEIRKQLYNYWKEFLPLLGQDLYSRYWFPQYVDVIASQLPEEYGDIIRDLYSRYCEQAKNNHKPFRKLRRLKELLSSARLSKKKT